MALLGSTPEITYYSRVFDEAWIVRFLDEMGLSSRPICGRTSTGGFLPAFADVHTALAAAVCGTIVEMHVQLGPDRDGMYGCLPFDIDVNKCLPRPCCGTAPKICDSCLPVILHWATFLKKAISRVAHINPSKILVVLSGGKGVHIWAPIKPVCKAQRDTLYEAVCNGTYVDSMLADIHLLLLKTPVAHLLHAFLPRVNLQGKEALLPCATPEAFITALYNHRRRTNYGEKLLDTIRMLYQATYPNDFDMAVTSSRTHNLRLPMTVNYCGGSVCNRRIAVVVTGKMPVSSVRALPTTTNLTDADVYMQAFEEVFAPVDHEPLLPRCFVTEQM